MGYWRFEGKYDSLVLGVSNSGYPKITGTASSHEVLTSSYYNPTGENEAQLIPWYEEKARFNENLSKLELSWNIHPGNATEADISPADLTEPTLHKRCQAAPESNHVFINYFDFIDDNETSLENRHQSVGFDIVLPPATFDKVWKLFERVLSEPEVSYILTVDFRGWMRERFGDESDDLAGKYKDNRLTMKEFSSGKNYYCNDIDFSIFNKKDKT